MRHLLLTAAAVLFSCTLASAQRNITFEDLINGERVSGVELSHGGKLVLEHFTVTDGPKTTRFSLVKDLAGGKQLARYDSVSVNWPPRKTTSSLRGRRPAPRRTRTFSVSGNPMTASPAGGTVPTSSATTWLPETPSGSPQGLIPTTWRISARTAAGSLWAPPAPVWKSAPPR